VSTGNPFSIRQCTFWLLVWLYWYTLNVKSVFHRLQSILAIGDLVYFGVPIIDMDFQVQITFVGCSNIDDLSIMTPLNMNCIKELSSQNESSFDW